MAARHFLSLQDLTSDELKAVIKRAIELKTQHRNGTADKPLEGKVLGMIFEKSSTRTRVSFEAGIAQLGGSALFLSSIILNFANDLTAMRQTKRDINLLIAFSRFFFFF